MHGIEFLRKHQDFRNYRLVVEVQPFRVLAQVLLALECDRLADTLEASRDATALPKS
jgi:hypothetical protein